MPSLRSLLSVSDLSVKETLQIFQRAKSRKAMKPKDKLNIQPVNAVCAFFEPSTRTLFSFEQALNGLSWHYSVINPEHSSLKKRESLRDTFDVLFAQGFRIAIIRHGQSSDVFDELNGCGMALINAGAGHWEHPTQGLLDAFTLWERWGDFKNKTITIVGDIFHSRVARSSGFLLKKLGAKIIFSGPPTWVDKEWSELGFVVETQLDRAIEEADAVMALRCQFERHGEERSPSREEYRRLYGLHAGHFKSGKRILMHPGPVNWGVELHEELRDYAHNLVLKQVENGVTIRQAVLEFCAGGLTP